jgi:hypothetical protein
MNRFEIAGSRLTLPRVINNVELAPEGNAGSVDFNLGTVAVQQNDGKTIAIALMLAETNQTFACLNLNIPSAKVLAEKLAELTALPTSAR